jgi:hypothetical protein
MTKISAWKCEICGKIFMENDGGFHAHGDIDIILGGSGMYDPEERIKFSDVCISCKSKLSNAIHDVLNKEDV